MIFQYNHKFILILYFIALGTISYVIDVRKIVVSVGKWLSLDV